MGWLEFWSKVIGHLAWPVAVIVLFYFLRNHISFLIEKIGKFKYKDIEVDFQKFKEKAENAFATNPTESQNARQSSTFSSLEEQIFRMIDESPEAAIALAWSAIEAAIVAAFSRIFNGKISGTPVYSLNKLKLSGALTIEQAALILSMRELRNSLMEQSGRGLMSRQQAFDYANAAVNQISMLNALRIDESDVVVPDGKWIALPPNFESVNSAMGGIWHYSNIRLADSNLTAGLGPFSGDNTFEIDIEMPIADGSRPIARQRFDQSLVDPSLLRAHASQLISFDKASGIVTFDLGRSVFKYKIDI